MNELKKKYGYLKYKLQNVMLYTAHRAVLNLDYIITRLGIYCICGVFKHFTKKLSKPFKKKKIIIARSK